jgi:hypothetical protein
MYPAAFIHLITFRVCLSTQIQRLSNNFNFKSKSTLSRQNASHLFHALVARPDSLRAAESTPSAFFH